jgi:hypothetical protein
MDQLYNLLGWDELPGTRDELEVLRIWIDELAQNKGEEWVRRHAMVVAGGFLLLIPIVDHPFKKKYLFS